jgi:hypothetical protein
MRAMVVRVHLGHAVPSHPSLRGIASLAYRSCTFGERLGRYPWYEHHP